MECSVCGQPANPDNTQTERKVITDGKRISFDAHTSHYCDDCFDDLIDYDLEMMSLEREHKRNRNKVKDPATGEMRPIRWVHDFPEIRDPKVAMPIIKQLTAKKRQLENEITLHQFSKEHYLAEAKRLELKKTMRCLYLVTLPNAPKSSRITDQDIELAKETNVAELAERLGLEVLTVSRPPKCCCPFHDENTPSMVLYDDHYFCFGACKEGGDAIKLYMKMQNVDFVTAVRELAGI